MIIEIARSDLTISACYPVMKALRPHIAETDFLPQVRRQEQSGYRLAYIEDEKSVVAVAGFRTGENLAWGRFLYVDDLVTHNAHRSRGYGSALLEWLRHQAIERGCKQLHLDSGLQREAAHRFYLREKMNKTSFHFTHNLMP